MFSLFVWVSLLLVRGNFEMWPALPDLSKSESICVLNEGTLSAGSPKQQIIVKLEDSRTCLVLAVSDIFKRLNSFLADFCQLPSFFRVQFQ